MPTAPNRSCIGCTRACPPELMTDGRCPNCAKDRGKQTYQDRNITDPHHQRYQTVEWHRTSKMFKDQNPICLAIEENGQQCRRPAQLVHHRIAAKERPDLFLDPKNLCALCSAHHGHTPGDAAGARYAPAEFYLAYLPGINLAEPNYSIAPPTRGAE